MSEVPDREKAHILFAHETENFAKLQVDEKYLKLLMNLVKGSREDSVAYSSLQSMGIDASLRGEIKAAMTPTIH